MSFAGLWAGYGEQTSITLHETFPNGAGELLSSRYLPSANLKQGSSSYLTLHRGKNAVIHWVPAFPGGLPGVDFGTLSADGNTVTWQGNGTSWKRIGPAPPPSLLLSSTHAAPASSAASAAASQASGAMSFAGIWTGHGQRTSVTLQEMYPNGAGELLSSRYIEANSAPFLTLHRDRNVVIQFVAGVPGGWSSSGVNFGTLSDDGNRVTWDNGTFWTRIGPAPPPSSSSSASSPATAASSPAAAAVSQANIALCSGCRGAKTVQCITCQGSKQMIICGSCGHIRADHRQGASPAQYNCAICQPDLACQENRFVNRPCGTCGAAGVIRCPCSK